MMVNYRGVWNATTAYNEKDMVRYFDDWYVCTKYAYGATKPPYNTLYWCRADESVAEAAEIVYDTRGSFIDSAAAKVESNIIGQLAGTCSTGAGTATKVVNGITHLTPGTLFRVVFATANTASSVSLKISNTTYPVDLGTHEKTEIKEGCLFMYMPGIGSGSTPHVKFIGGNYS